MKTILTTAALICLIFGVGTSIYADAALDAASLISQRKLDEAISFLNEQVVKDPSYADLHYWLGRAYIEKENWSEAEKALNKCLELKKKHEEAKAYLALVYIHQEKWEEAKKILDEGVAKSKSVKGRFLDHLGKYHMARKEFSEADLAFRKAQLEEPENIEYQRDLADLNYENGVYAVAIQLYQEILARDSMDVPTHYRMGRAYYMQKQFSEALQSINKAIGLDSNYTQAYHLAGDIYMLSGLSKVQAALAQDPSNGASNGYTDIFKNAIWAYEHYLSTGGQETVDVDYRLGQAYYYVGAYEVAIERLTKAIEMGTDKSVAYDFKAKSLFRLKRFDEAIAAYKAYEDKISKGDPNFVWGKEHFEFFRDRALTYHQLYYDAKKEGIVDTTFLVDAMPHYVKAIELNDKEVFLWNRLALVYYDLGRYTDAIPLLERRIAEDSTHLSSYQYLAFSYLKMSDYPKATQYLEKMYELNPKSEFVVKTLAMTYLFQMKDREKGRKFMNLWRELAPQNYEPAKWLGYLAISEKPANKEQAINHLEKAYQLMEANGVDKCKEIDVIIWLAQANSFYDDIKHDDEALKWIKRGRACDPNNETLKSLQESLE